MSNLLKTKKTQSKWSIEVSKQTYFNGLAKKEVEVDMNIDKEEFAKINAEMKILYPVLRSLTKDKIVNYIRFRKFTNKVDGRYYFIEDTILINYSTRGYNSFIHEYGHALDNRYMIDKTGTFEPLSTSNEFTEIVNKYVEIYTKTYKGIKLKEGVTYYSINDEEEIFANAFRYYVLSNVIDRELKKGKKEMVNYGSLLPVDVFVNCILGKRYGTNEYMMYLLREDIIKYFNQLFNQLFNGKGRI